MKNDHFALLSIEPPSGSLEATTLFILGFFSGTRRCHPPTILSVRKTR